MGKWMGGRKGFVSFTFALVEAPQNSQETWSKAQRTAWKDI